MGKFQKGHKGMNGKGVVPPQQGRIAPQADTPAIVTAGGAPRDSAATYPAMSGIRSGTPPKESVPHASGGDKVRTGGNQGGVGTKSGTGTKQSVSAGAAPVSGMSAPGAGKMPSDRDNQVAQIGRRGYAMGGKVNRHGAEKSAVPAGGGNGGVKGGNAPIPVAQPGGLPSTGVTAGGTMPMTSDTMGQESTVAAAPKLRGAMLKRAGGMPSLPRPRR